MVEQHRRGPSTGRLVDERADAAGEGRHRRTPRGRSRPGEREQRCTDVDAGRAYLSASGPHRCDVCGTVVSTLSALREGCSEHDPARPLDGDDVRTGSDRTDLNVLVADVCETARLTARQTGRDPVELQTAAARALLRASREEAGADGSRAAVDDALERATPSSGADGPTAEYELVRETVATDWHAGGPETVSIPEAAQYVDVRYDGFTDGSEPDLEAEIRYLLAVECSDD